MHVIVYFIVQSRTIGEFQHLSSDAAITTIGAVIRGTATGRKDAEQVTVFDGTGVGLQDLACAQAVTEAIGDT